LTANGSRRGEHEGDGEPKSRRSIFLNLGLFQFLSFMRRRVFYTFMINHLYDLMQSVTFTALFGTLDTMASALGQNLLWGRTSDRYRLRTRLIIAGESITALAYFVVYLIHRSLIGVCRYHPRNNDTAVWVERSIFLDNTDCGVCVCGRHNPKREARPISRQIQLRDGPKLGTCSTPHWRTFSRCPSSKRIVFRHCVRKHFPCIINNSSVRDDIVRSKSSPLREQTSQILRISANQECVGRLSWPSLRP
jgi:hypothetical protein